MLHDLVIFVSIRENSDIFRSVQKLQRFSVPQFMLNKMKEFVRNVQGMYVWFIYWIVFIAVFYDDGWVILTLPDHVP